MTETDDDQLLPNQQKVVSLTAAKNDEPGLHMDCTEFLDEMVLAEIFSYCTPPELIRLRFVNPIFRRCSKLAIGRAKDLHLSFLVQLEQTNPSLKQNQKTRKRPRPACLSSSPQESSKDVHYTEQCLSSILQDAGQNSLENIEFECLRYVTGSYSNWLRNLCSFTKLQTLNFSGCSKLHPRCFQHALEQISQGGVESSALCQNLVYLNLQGCLRIDDKVVHTIAQTLPKLQYLLLSNCSVLINDECVIEVFRNLRHLRALDLSGLKYITEAIFDMEEVARVYLPPKLEHLRLAACERIRFTWLRPLAHNMLHALHNVDASTNKQSGADGLVNLLQHVGNWKTWKNFVQYLIVNNIGHPNALERHHLLINPSWEGQLSMIDFTGLGTPRLGLINGALGIFACMSRGNLREVRVSGSEQISDDDVLILASTCRKSLVCLEMTACAQIGDPSLISIGEWCESLAELNISSCFRITDDGIMALCPEDNDQEQEDNQMDSNHVQPSQNDNSGVDDGAQPFLTMKQHRGCSSLRSLGMLGLPSVTDDVLPSIAKLTKLLHLDIRNCSQLTAFEISKTVIKCSSLIEIDARDTDNPRLLPGLVKPVDSGKAKLRFVNGRKYRHALPLNESVTASLCTVHKCSRRLGNSQGVDLEIMHHCVECQLLPSNQRGICSICVSKCHKGHRTFIGAYTRFFCDCAFLKQDCNAI